jgi:hypothetical protein
MTGLESRKAIMSEKRESVRSVRERITAMELPDREL